MDLKNKEKWRLYMDNVSSPMSFIDAGWSYLIAAALQRRVWCPPDHARIYANQFTIVTGPPATGKGLVIKPVLKILNHYKLINPAHKKYEGLSSEDKAIKEAIDEANFSLASGAQKSTGDDKEKVREREEPLLIPIAADATTYEALIRALARSVRRVDYSVYDEKMQKNIPKIDTHSSLCFCLEEISSLFKRNREDVVKLLLNAYDCGDYTYDTKTQGKDKIKRCCLNFFGGTTPGFIQSVFDEKILDDGFSSRTWFITETKPRKRNFFMKELSPEQRQAELDIIEHVGKVAKLYGSVNVSQEIRDRLEEWIKTEHSNRINASSKLEGYYGRYNLHIMKRAMAIHFGESTSMTMEWECFEKAIADSREVEKKMHYALEFAGVNPLFKAAKKCLQFLMKSPAGRSRNELLVELAEDLPNFNTAIDEVLEYLMTSDDIEGIEKPTKAGGKKIYWQIKEKEPQPSSHD